MVVGIDVSRPVYCTAGGNSITVHLIGAALQSVM